MIHFQTKALTNGQLSAASEGITRQVYNLFQDLWNRLIILGGGAGCLAALAQTYGETGFEATITMLETNFEQFLEELCGI